MFSIVKAFRGGEVGPRHGVEFTIAEWYRLGPLAGLLREMDLLLGDLAAAPRARVRPYAELFREAVGADPLAAPDDLLFRLAEAHGHPGPPDDRAGALDFLFTRLVEPGLAHGPPTLVTRYPAPLAALARLADDDPRTAERFELFWKGLELANGYDELQDAAEHRRRFARENEVRARLGLPPATADPRLLAALEGPGLPRCSGVALGVDRLVMAILDAETLDEVVVFREGSR